MSGGLVGLLDDIAALAKLAAASIDDVGAAAGKASIKAAGVVVDDTAVTPAYVHGLAAKRELPIIRRIATGSLKNKVLFILPAALLLSAVAPILVEIILMLGGTYLCYEGAEKVLHRISGHDDGHELPAAAVGVDQEEETIAAAIRTDFILSAEIMVIALKEVLDKGFVSRAAILVIVAGLITVMVYGVVALIVKMDDIGLVLVGTARPSAMRIGRMLVTGMPKVLAVLSTVGTAAMIWVGGGIILHGLEGYGLGWPAHALHDAGATVARAVPSAPGLVAWLVEAAGAGVAGFAIGLLAIPLTSRLLSPLWRQVKTRTRRVLLRNKT